jgi:hypothetical protein
MQATPPQWFHGATPAHVLVELPRLQIVLVGFVLVLAAPGHHYLVLSLAQLGIGDISSTPEAQLQVQHHHVRAVQAAADTIGDAGSRVVKTYVHAGTTAHIPQTVTSQVSTCGSCCWLWATTLHHRDINAGMSCWQPLVEHMACVQLHRTQQ